MSLASRFVNTWKGNGGHNGPALVEASLSTPWWKWTRDIPQTTTNVIILASFVFALLALAWWLDYLASSRLYKLLCASEELEVLKSTETLKGVPFYLDRLLDPATPLYSEANMSWARTRLRKYRPQPASDGKTLTPSRTLSDNVEDPVAQLLGSKSASLQTHRRVTSTVIAWGGKQHGEGGGRSCTSRCRALHPFILQYTGHRLYFGHKLLVPFTTFDPLRSRLSRTTLVLCELLLTLWLGSIFYNFRSDAPGLGPGFNLAEDGPNAIMISIIIIPVNMVIVNALAIVLFAVEDFAFEQRYPFIAAEIQRRKAAERRLVALGDAELAAELERAMRLGREALEGGGEKEGGNSAGNDGIEGEAAAIGGVGSGGGGVLAVRESEAENRAANYLLMAPKSDVLLLTAAAQLGVTFESKSDTAAKQGITSNSSRSGAGIAADDGEGGEGKGSDEGSPNLTSPLSSSSSSSSSSRISNSSGEFASSSSSGAGSGSTVHSCWWCCCRPPPKVYPTAYPPPTATPGSSSSRSSSERAAHTAEKKARALAAAERELKEAQLQFEAVEADGRAAYLAPLEWYTWGITLPFLLGLTTAAALGVFFLVFLWYLLLFGKIHGDATTSFWLVQWVLTQLAQHALLSILVPYLGTSWTYCLVPAWRATLRHLKRQQQQAQAQGQTQGQAQTQGLAQEQGGAASGGGGGSILLLLLLHQCCGGWCGCSKRAARKHPGAEAAEEEARGRIMTQAASIASDLPPAFAFFAYAFAFAAGSATVAAGDRVAAFAKSALQGKDAAALEEVVKEEEAKALGMKGMEGGEEEGEEEASIMRLTPSQLHLLTVSAPMLQKGVAAVAAAAAAASSSSPSSSAGTAAGASAVHPASLPGVGGHKRHQSNHGTDSGAGTGIIGEAERGGEGGGGGLRRSSTTITTPTNAAAAGVGGGGDAGVSPPPHPHPSLDTETYANLNLSRMGAHHANDEAGRIARRIQERHEAVMNLPGIRGGGAKGDRGGEEGGAKGVAGDAAAAAAAAPPLDTEVYNNLNLSRMGAHARDEGERIARRIKERHEAVTKHLPGAAKKGGKKEGEERGERTAPDHLASSDSSPAATAAGTGTTPPHHPLDTEVYESLNLSRLGSHAHDEGDRIAQRIQERREAAKHLPGIHGKGHKGAEGKGGGGEGGNTASRPHSKE